MEIRRGVTRGEMREGFGGHRMFLGRRRCRERDVKERKGAMVQKRLRKCK